MYIYSIYPIADETIFKKQCLALEKHIPDLTLVYKVTDVDGTKIREYSLDGKKVFVFNSYYLNEVYVQSEVPLEQL